MTSPEYWFVGAFDDGAGQDLTDSFLDRGEWVNGYATKYTQIVNSIAPGDRIAIKSTFTQAKDLPFENRGNSVSVMAIKAIGTVTENSGDGHTLKVAWTPLTPHKRWYFWTNRKTMWRLDQTNPRAQELIDFAFYDIAQDIDSYRNSDYWKSRFGDTDNDRKTFEWIPFFEGLATAIRPYRRNRAALLDIVRKVADELPITAIPIDRYPSGESQPASDTCPFTFFGIFNKGLKAENRTLIAQALADQLDLKIKAPDSFEGIPVLNNQSAWFYSYASERDPGDIDKLWDLFESALDFADNEAQSSEKFEESFANAQRVRGSKWNLTMGLFWIRPHAFVPLDTVSRNFIEGTLGVTVDSSAPTGMISASEYVELIELLNLGFERPEATIRSFPQLSLSAWQGTREAIPLETPTQESYGISNIVEDGCFADRSVLQQALERLLSKRNLIIQGPPGTGKTWLARRLAYAAMGEATAERMLTLQFHANMSYEDFARGWRPNASSQLDLVDGPFLQMVEHARNNPQNRFVVVIEEINRGNPAQIFGELLTLIEADKRSPVHAMQLTYSRNNNETVFVPENLYVIGTMNLADRSLALMDYAFRRRFSFIDLEPTWNVAWRNWLAEKCGIADSISKKIANAMISLNAQIAESRSLGPAYRLGHSFFTQSDPVANPQSWIEAVLETEIRPCLNEYWFDEPSNVETALAAFWDHVQ